MLFFPILAHATAVIYTDYSKTSVLTSDLEIKPISGLEFNTVTFEYDLQKEGGISMSMFSTGNSKIIEKDDAIGLSSSEDASFRWNIVPVDGGASYIQMDDKKCWVKEKNTIKLTDCKKMGEMGEEYRFYLEIFPSINKYLGCRLLVVEKADTPKQA